MHSVFLQLINLLLLYIIGYVGYRLGERLKLPNSSLLGPLFTIGILRLIDFGIPVPPDWFSVVIQLVLGTILGLRLDRESLPQIVTLFKPIIIIIFWAFSVTFSLGFILYNFFNLDIYTSIMSASPGGLTEMTILASETGAELPIVILTHSIRMITAVSLLPIFLVKYREVIKNYDVQNVKSDEVENSNANISTNKRSLSRIILTGTLGILGGVSADYLGVPAGALIGSFLMASIISIAGYHPGTPKKYIHTILLIGVGIMVSDTFNLASLTNLRIIVAALTGVVFIYIASFILFLIFRRITDWDLGTCLLAAAPGGMTAMTVLVLDLDVPPFQVTLLQLFRVITLKVVLPIFFVIIS